MEEKENKSAKKPDEKKVDKKAPKNVNNIINTHPQLPEEPVVEGSAVAKNSLAEKVLSLSARRNRSVSAKRNHSRIERGKKIAAPRHADEDHLKARAEKKARDILRKKFAGERGAHYSTLSPSDKMSVDKMLDGKVAIIRKLAAKLLTRVRQAETQRYQDFHAKNKNLKKPRQVLVNSMEDELIDAYITEDYNDRIEKLLRMGLADPQKLAQCRRILKDPSAAIKNHILRDPLVKMLDNLTKIITDDDIIFQKVLAYVNKNKKSLKEQKVQEALEKKSKKHGISYDVLEEVFNRGFDTWTPYETRTQEQFAFDRVNSFINNGQARALDKDLIENKTLLDRIKKHIKET